MRNILMSVFAKFFLFLLKQFVEIAFLFTVKVALNFLRQILFGDEEGAVTTNNI